MPGGAGKVPGNQWHRHRHLYLDTEQSQGCTRQGKVQLISASGEAFWSFMRKSLGSKRRYLPETAIAEIARLYAAFENGETSKLFDTTDFGYRRITVERPLQLSFHPQDETRRPVHWRRSTRIWTR